MKIVAVTLSAAAFVAVVVACGGSPSSTGFDEGAGSSGSSGGGGGGSSGSSGSSGTFNGGGGDAGGAGCSDPSAGDLRSCGCPGEGATRACWTVPPSKRNGQGCKDGVQTCQKQGEFSQWGACTGEVTTCASGVTGADASTPPPPPPPPPNCACYPGAVRWCDTPAGCNWGKQACNPDGTWGACNETNDRPPGCNDPNDPSYDETCCLAANQCCQDFESIDDQKSKGHCDQIACTGDIAK